MNLEHDLLQLARDAMRSLMNGRDFAVGQTGHYLNIISRIEAELSRPQINEFYPDWETLQPFYDRIKELEQELAKPKLRRGDVLRCAETNELCIVWTTSTSGKTLVKWGGNDFGAYTAEQIGELFWLEPKPEQEPQFAPVGEIRSSVWAGRNWAHHFNAEAKLDLKTKLYIKLEHEHE
jgi:hypothetical protein